MLTLLHSERPKLYTILAFLSAIGLNSVELFIRRKARALSVLINAPIPCSVR